MTRDILRVALSGASVAIALWVATGLPHDQSTAGRIASYAIMTVTVLASVVFANALAKLGRSSNAEERDGMKVVRFGIGLRLGSVAMAVFLLRTALLLVLGIAERSLKNSALAEGIILALGIGALGVVVLYVALAARIHYDDGSICARFDNMGVKEHCHRWADLLQIEQSRDQLILRFRDGGSVKILNILRGRDELREFAYSVLARRLVSDPER